MAEVNGSNTVLEDGVSMPMRLARSAFGVDIYPARCVFGACQQYTEILGV